MLRKLFGALLADQEPSNGPISQDLFEGEDNWSPSHLYDSNPQILVEDSTIVRSDEFSTFLSHGSLLVLVVVLLLYGSYTLFHYKNMKKDENIKNITDDIESMQSVSTNHLNSIKNDSIIRLSTIDPSVLNIHDSAII